MICTLCEAYRGCLFVCCLRMLGGRYPSAICAVSMLRIADVLLEKAPTKFLLRCFADGADEDLSGAFCALCYHRH